MSYYICRYCGGPATWYSTHCYLCAQLAEQEVENDARRLASEIVRQFQNELNRTSPKQSGGHG